MFNTILSAAQARSCTFFGVSLKRPDVTGCFSDLDTDTLVPVIVGGSESEVLSDRWSVMEEKKTGRHRDIAVEGSWLLPIRHLVCGKERARSDERTRSHGSPPASRCASCPLSAPTGRQWLGANVTCQRQQSWEDI